MDDPTLTNGVFDNCVHTVRLHFPYTTYFAISDFHNLRNFHYTLNLFEFERIVLNGKMIYRIETVEMK